MDVSATSAMAQANSPRSRAALTSDFETFLNLMTTQLRHQDPMKPVDSTEYLSQLASFSTVEQQAYTNKLLESLITGFGTMGLTQVASWVGSEARAVMPAAVSGRDPITLFPHVSENADRAVLVVRDADGTVVNRIDLPVETTEYEWSPQDLLGDPLPDGIYSLEVENYRGETQDQSGAVELYGRVTEVRALDDGLVLRIEGGREVAVDAVTAIRG